MDLGGFDGSRTWARESGGQGSSPSSHGSRRWPGVFWGEEFSLSLAGCDPPEVAISVEVFTSIMCVCALSLQPCPTLCNPWTVACQAPLSMGLSRNDNA